MLEENIGILSIIGTLLVVIVILLLNNCAESASCHRTANKMKLNSAYGLVTGCMVQSKAGDWVPLDNYRYMGD